MTTTSARRCVALRATKRAKRPWVVGALAVYAMRFSKHGRRFRTPLRPLIALAVASVALCALAVPRPAVASEPTENEWSGTAIGQLSPASVCLNPGIAICRFGQASVPSATLIGCGSLALVARGMCLLPDVKFDFTVYGQNGDSIGYKDGLLHFQGIDGVCRAGTRTFQGTATVLGGTGRFAHATGSIVLWGEVSGRGITQVEDMTVHWTGELYK